MKGYQLSEIMKFSLGKNPTRLRDTANNIYGQEDFENDLHSRNDSNDESCCIINLIKSKAAPISAQSEEKFLTSNFLRCEINPRQLNPWYFCFQFNEGKGFERQIEQAHQGTTLSVKKLNVKTIGELEINLPDIQRQRLIGKIYRQMIMQNDLMIEQANLVKEGILTILGKMEEGEDDHKQ